MQGQLKSHSRQTRRSSCNTAMSPGTDRKATIMSGQPLSPAKKLAKMMREHQSKKSSNVQNKTGVWKTRGKNTSNSEEQDAKVVNNFSKASPYFETKRKATVMSSKSPNPAKKQAKMINEHHLKESSSTNAVGVSRTSGKKSSNKQKHSRTAPNPDTTTLSTEKDTTTLLTEKESVRIRKYGKVSNTRDELGLGSKTSGIAATKNGKPSSKKAPEKNDVMGVKPKGDANSGDVSPKKRSKHNIADAESKRPKKVKMANGQPSAIRGKPQPELEPSTSSPVKKRRPKKLRPASQRDAPDAAAAGDIAALLRLGEGAAAAAPISDDSDWEAVDTHASDLATKGFVEVTLPSDVAIKKKKKKGFDVEAYMKRQLSRARRELQQLLHKTHLLCLLSRALQLNALLNSETPLGCAMSMLPSKYAYPPKRVAVSYVEAFLKWFREKVPMEAAPEGGRPSEDVFHTLELRLRTKKAHSALDLVCLFVLILRAIGVDCRLVMSLQPVPLKPTSPPSNTAGKTATATAGKSLSKCKQKPKPDKKEAKQSDSAKKATAAGGSSKAKRAAPTAPARTGSDRKAKRRSDLPPAAADSSDDSSGDEFVPRRPDRRILSSSSSPESGAGRTGRAAVDCWAEVYVEEELRWISVDVVGGGVHCVAQIRKRATAPLVYVLGCDNAGHLKDLTARYDPKWHSSTRKLRVEPDWWEEAIGPWRPVPTRRDKEEDEEMLRDLQERPMPQSIAEFKDHPLYALERHLLKFEAIYPRTAVPLGYIGKGERRCPVYARECVRTLHARETWIKQARVVNEGEKPYKIVKARPKWDKLLQKVITDKPLDVFGRWQTSEYVPPRAEGGKVPRNDYGNVELFKPSMLPGGTVHLNVEGLSRVAKRLGIDCAPAMVGWDYHCGGSHPVFEGYVVCEEFEDTLMDAWEADQREAQRRQREKRQKRVLDNWRRLVRGLLIRQRLARKYDFQEVPTKRPATDRKDPGRPGAGKKARLPADRRDVKIEPGPEPPLLGLEPTVKVEPAKTRAVAKPNAKPRLAGKLSAKMLAAQAPKPEPKEEAGSDDEPVPETQEEVARRVEASMASMGLTRVALSSDSEAESDAEGGSGCKTGTKPGAGFGAAVLAKLSPAAAGGSSRSPAPGAAQRGRRSAPSARRRVRKASPGSRSPSPVSPGADGRTTRRRSARAVTVDYRETAGSGSDCEGDGAAPVREDDLTSDEEQPFVGAAAGSSDDDDDFMGF